MAQAQVQYLEWFCYFYKGGLIFRSYMYLCWRIQQSLITWWWWSGKEQKGICDGAPTQWEDVSTRRKYEEVRVRRGEPEGKSAIQIMKQNNRRNVGERVGWSGGGGGAARQKRKQNVKGEGTPLTQGVLSCCCAWTSKRVFLYCITRINGIIWLKLDLVLWSHLERWGLQIFPSASSTPYASSKLRVNVRVLCSCIKVSFMAFNGLIQQSFVYYTTVTIPEYLKK